MLRGRSVAKAQERTGTMNKRPLLNVLIAALIAVGILAYMWIVFPLPADSAFASEIRALLKGLFAVASMLILAKLIFIQLDPRDKDGKFE
jgi:hypothetical protein